ncbi:response regulator [Allosphingosinicella vermicomposti]|uniref:response regulator n=1 Tax=Allosphingosinicella vermicomposti TaxID=614671 RepID=UPI000D100587|nr:response regulator [Allosphingosinicella vermicomposti]
MVEPTPLRKAAAPQFAPLAEGRPRVLIVDDDERNLLALKTVVDEVADTVVASSGEEALRHLLNGEFAVILLDVFMPGLDGYETAQMIRSREQTKRIPIIFLSAVNKESAHLNRGYAMGAVDYVFKPVEPLVLRSKVSVFVDLFAKTREIQHKAEQEQRLLDENLRIQAEKLRAEQALRDAEKRQAAIIESLPIVLFVREFGPDFTTPRIVGGNLARISGFETPPPVEEWHQRLHADDRARVMSGYRSLEYQNGLAIEYRWQCADGAYRHFLEQTMVLADEYGGREVVGTLLDVTERRELESQLVQAQKLDAIGKLTGGIAHDFNNLLAAVLGGIDLIDRRVALAEDQRKILTMTRRAAEQGSDLVRRLLAFSRRQQLQPAPVSVAQLSTAVGDLLNHTLGGLVELDWSIASQPWNVFADEAQLELALMNLVINARDAMPDGGRIEVHARNKVLEAGNEHDLPEGDYVSLTVIDTGSGIAPDDLERVMEPFFTTKEVGKGTGLGLSMVYGFAKQSGGGIRIQSRVGEGTSVELLLPRAASDAAATETASRQRVEPVDTGPGLRVLLIDDHAGVRTTTTALLSDFGHQVAEASDGLEAIAAMSADTHCCDLVITDYAMPSLSGIEVVRRLRELRPDLPAIIITGYADADNIQNRPANVTVLTKPFTPEKLTAAIRRAVPREMEMDQALPSAV